MQDRNKCEEQGRTEGLRDGSITWPKCAHWAAMASGTAGNSTASLVPRNTSCRLARTGRSGAKGTLRSSDAADLDLVRSAVVDMLCAVRAVSDRPWGPCRAARRPPASDAYFLMLRVDSGRRSISFAVRRPPSAQAQSTQPYPLASLLLLSVVEAWVEWSHWAACGRPIYVQVQPSLRARSEQSSANE